MEKLTAARQLLKSRVGLCLCENLYLMSSIYRFSIPFGTGWNIISGSIFFAKSDMKKNKKDSIYLLKAKNLVRGALSPLRATNKPVMKRDEWKLGEWKHEQFSHQQINKALALAKRELSQKQLAEFERWVADFIREQNHRSRHLGTYITSLGLLPNELQPRNLTTELNLSVDQIKRQLPELLVFAKEFSNLAKVIDIKDWVIANSILNAIRDREGYSYWAIETEIALKQKTDGVEAVKALISSMTISSFGLNKFFLYYFGVRNEPAQTSSRFKVNLKRKISDSDLSSVLQAYSKFRLYGGLETEESNLAAVLAYEQLTTTIDLLFTLIRVVKFMLLKRIAFSVESMNAAEQATEALQPILSIMGIGRELKQNELIDKLPTIAADPNSRLQRIAHQAIKMAIQPRDKWGLVDTSQSVIIQGLASQLSTRDDGISAEELAKMLLNFSWLPIIIELGDISTVPPLPILLATFSKYNSGVCDPPTSILEALHSTVISMTCVTPRKDIVELLPLINGIQAYINGDLSNSLNTFITTQQSNNKVIQDASMVLLANFNHENGNTQETLKICAEAGINNDSLVSMLPLAELFQGVRWATLQSFSNSVDLAISLDLFLRGVEDRKIRTYKRYSIEELMRLHSNCNVVDLADHLVSIGVKTEKIEYLLCNVCDLVTLELLPGMGDSRKVLLTRSQILRRLAAFQTKKEVAYLQESSDIDDSLQVNDGLIILDDSKVYVDELAILNYVNQEMAADFQRYLKLVESGLGLSDSLSEVMKSFKNPSAQTFQIPKNDADDLLAEIFSSILDKFLFDPASGLDIIIGRRIRHGTISSEIRGYLESVDLIGQKPHAGADYDAPLRVVSQSLKLDTKRRRIIKVAFSRFSDSIDQLIALLRDEYFHVRTKAKPRGIFALHVDPISLALARSIAQTCNTIDQFSKECIQIYWFFLSVRVNASRPTTESEMKKALNTVFSKLIGEVKALDLADPELLTCLQQASEELQRRAFTIASWIRVPKANIEGASYSLQRVVDVAVAMIKGQRPGFSPIVTTVSPESIQLDTHGFSIVADALYIALDNICAHSGKKVNNDVRVEIKYCENTSLLTFKITNEIAPGSRTLDKDARINATRSDIQKRVYGERARLDRGSGLSKLAALVMQSEKTTISFGYDSSNLFELKFDLLYVGISNTSIQSQHISDTLLSEIDTEMRR